MLRAFMSIVDNLDDRDAIILNEFIDIIGWGWSWVDPDSLFLYGTIMIELGITYPVPIIVSRHNSLKHKEEVIDPQVDNLLKNWLLEQVDVRLILINYELGIINIEIRQSNNRLYIIIRLNPTYNININSLLQSLSNLWVRVIIGLSNLILCFTILLVQGISNSIIIIL